MDVLRKAILRAGGFSSVSESTGVAESHLYNLCNGHKPLTAKVMRRLRKAVHLRDTDWIGLMEQAEKDAPQRSRQREARA